MSLVFSLIAVILLVVSLLDLFHGQLLAALIFFIAAVAVASFPRYRV